MLNNAQPTSLQPCLQERHLTEVCSHLLQPVEWTWEVRRGMGFHTHHWPLDDTYLAPAVSLTKVLVGIMPACASDGKNPLSVHACQHHQPTTSLPLQQEVWRAGSSKVCRHYLDLT